MPNRSPALRRLACGILRPAGSSALSSGRGSRWPIEPYRRAGIESYGSLRGEAADAARSSCVLDFQPLIDVITSPALRPALAAGLLESAPETRAPSASFMPGYRRFPW
jgi:hypothetical protein